jgi:hypothetical protein
MLFIGVVVVLVIYLGVYLLWDAPTVSLSGGEGAVRSIANAILRPETDLFFILRSLLVIALVYVVADHFFFAAKRALKRKKQEPIEIKPTFKETNDHTYRDS